jgi:hypothetical protein
MEQTIFKTKDGQIIYKARVPRMHAAARAVKKAIEKGVKTLIAVEPDGRVTDYSNKVATV